MALQTPVGSGPTTLSQNMRGDRRRRMIDALQELKNNIARIEQDHPGLGNDLSSTCERLLTELEKIRPLQPDVITPETITADSRSTASNPLAKVVDNAGACIISGLDRMGDGIIFVFSSIGRLLK